MADRALAVIVNDDLKVSDEVVAVMEMERASNVTLVVEEFEFVLPALGEVRGQPSPSFADGLRVQEMLDAVHRSQQQHKWVDVSGARWPTAPPR